jgi:hypothetical protein
MIERREIERREIRLPLARIMIQVGAHVFLLVAAVLILPRVRRGDDAWAMLAALIFFQMSLVMMLVHTLRPQDAPQRLRPVSQVLGYLMSGVALLIPMIAPGALAPNTLFALFFVVVAGSLVASWRVWGAADELMRRMLKDSRALAFSVTSAALCVYAAGERLGALSGITFWGYFVFCSLVKVASEWDTRQVSNLQADYVEHCGRSNAGDYIHTLSLADIASGWWEGEPIPARTQKATQEALQRIRKRIPFRIREIYPDNDGASGTGASGGEAESKGDNEEHSIGSAHVRAAAGAENGRRELAVRCGPVWFPVFDSLY